MLSLEEAKRAKNYFKAVLLDEMGVELIDTIGRFETKEETVKEIENYIEGIDGDTWVEIYEHRDNRKYAVYYYNFGKLELIYTYWDEEDAK